MTRRTYPDGTVVDYGYDDDGRMSSVATGGSSTQYAYDPAGNLVHTTFPITNGHGESRQYDRAGRLTEVSNARAGSVLSFARYTRDAAGNPTAVETQLGVTTYTYDILDRLTGACFAPACAPVGDPLFVSYAYDAVSNRTSETRFTGTTAYQYNEADQLLQRAEQSEPNRTFTYTYDAAGNLLTGDGRRFTYDAANRVRTATAGVTTSTYSYDGAGKRLKTETSVLGVLGFVPPSASFQWDPNGPYPQLLAERTVGGGPLRRYVNGVRRISVEAGDKKHFYHYDGIASVTDVTSEKGGPEWSYTYEPFGAARTEARLSSEAPDNPMRFAGEYLGSDSGLYHLRAREYDPSLGRFTQTDPLAPLVEDPYVSAYVYTNSRPTVFVDPTGLFCILGDNPSGSCRGTGLMTRIGHVSRFARTSALTAAAYGWAEANGGDCSLQRRLTVVCDNMDAWANGPAPALTIGSTVLSDEALSPALFRHESKHADQWGIFGESLALLYLVNEAASRLAGSGSCENFFEKAAGFEDGRYYECVSPTTQK